MTKLFASLACLGFFAAPTAIAADAFEGIDDYIQDGMETWKVPGLAIAVVRDGKVILARGYGTREIHSDAPVVPETIFPIASCTKAFTAACIALMVDEGLVNWDDPVRNHLEEFRVADPYVTEHATLKDLLCHRTGLVRGDLLGMTGNFTDSQMLPQLQFLPQVAPFRAKVTYSSLMYWVLGEVVHRRAGSSWSDYVRNRLLAPLGMHATTTDHTEIAAELLATRHRLYEGSLETLRGPYSDGMQPASAIHSNVLDMAKWLAFHLDEGEVDGRPLVSRTSMREMHSLQASIPVHWRPDSDEYDARVAGAGLGWYVRDYRGRMVVQHGGAWGAEMAIVPEERLGVVVLSNRDYNGLVWMLVYDAIDACLLGPEQAWNKSNKWDRWLEIGGPDKAARELHQQRAILKQGVGESAPSLPLAGYAGDYHSTLYGKLTVAVDDERLEVRFGRYLADLDHWELDSFYGRSVVEPFLDWLVKFETDPGGVVQGLEIIHVGWTDPDERFLFARVTGSQANRD